MTEDNANDSPRILVVDDEPSVRRACAFTLRAEGWRTETEEGPRSALERLARGDKFDVLVLDYAMPEMDGLMMLAELERIQGLDAVPPVVLASAHADGAVAWDALRFGVWDFLAKPLTPEELRRRVRRLLKRPLAAVEGSVREQALLLASKREWRSAQEVLTSSNVETTETDALIAGLLAQLRGDDDEVQRCFRRAHWWPEWRRHGSEIWIELARRLDCA